DFALTVNTSEGLKVTAPRNLPLAAGQRQRQIFNITVGNVPGDVDLTVSGTAGKFSDKVTRRLHIVPKGFPTQLAYGGLLEPDSNTNKKFIIPNSIVANSMETAVTVYSSPVANLTEAVAALMKQPRGCFEQTSSTNYPLAMAQQYFIKHQGVDPKMIA